LADLRGLSLSGQVSWGRSGTRFGRLYWPVDDYPSTVG